jgi:hypothetical protein
MSTPPPTLRKNGAPRWSCVSFDDPALIAGLPGSKAETGNELRAAFVAKGAKFIWDLPNYGLEMLTDEKLRKMGVTDPVVLNNLNNFLDSGFHASVYRDYVKGPNSYFLTFKPTDIASFDDWMTNIGQAQGELTAQYVTAMELSTAVPAEFARVTSSRGHVDLMTAGWSLGGGLASAASVWGNLPGYTFNNSGLHLATIKRYNLSLPVAQRRPEAELRYFDPPITTHYNFLDPLTIIQTANPSIPNAIAGPEGPGSQPIVRLEDVWNIVDDIDVRWAKLFLTQLSSAAGTNWHCLKS